MAASSSWSTVLCGSHPTHSSALLGLARYPSPYQMFRSGFPPRMPPMVVLPKVLRPPIPGVRPTVTPVVRPLVLIVAPSKKPQTIVYVGKIAPTVDNEFLLSLLKLETCSRSL